MAPLDTRRLPLIILLIVLAVILAGAHFAKRPLQENAGTAQTLTKSAPIPPEYICLDEAIKGEAPDGSTVFVSIQVKPGQCESAVMPSPLSKEDSDLPETVFKGMRTERRGPRPGRSFGRVQRC